MNEFIEFLARFLQGPHMREVEKRLADLSALYSRRADRRAALTGLLAAGMNTQQALTEADAIVLALEEYPSVGLPSRIQMLDQMDALIAYNATNEKERGFTEGVQKCIEIVKGEKENSR